MSLLKWTLAAAGTVIGMRYMSDRHRRRIADGGSRPAQTDRDDSRNSGAPWSPAQGSDEIAGGPGTGLGAGLGSNIAAGGAASFVQDDLLAPDSDSTPGSSSNRF